MATLEELVVRIKADASQLDRELRRVSGVTQQHTQKMSSAFGVLKTQLGGLVPALSAAALVSFGKEAVDAAGHIKDLADRIGFSASTLSALEGPLRTSGSNLDEFAASINRMNNLVGEAAKGVNQEAVKAFDQLRLSVRKLQEMSPEEQFYAITEAIAGLGTQAKITEAGNNIFGKSFAAMQPTLKEHNGNMREAVQSANDMKEAISEDTLDRIDEFGDSLARAAISARNEFLQLLAVILEVIDAIPDIPDPEDVGERLGASLREAMGLPPPGAGMQSPFDVYADKAGAGGFATSATKVRGFTFDAQGNLVKPGGRSGKGDNRSLFKMSDEQKQIESATKAYQEYLDKLDEENYLLHVNEKERAGVKALLEAETLAKKANITISEEQRQEIMATANANAQLADSMEEAARFSKELKDKFSDALTDIVFNFDNASDAAANFMKTLAQMIVQKKIMGPLSDALLGSDSGGKGLLDDLFGGIGSMFGGFFADGGQPPVGKVSVVGENGPELFVPSVPGTIVPNGGGMGGVSVTNVFQISTGVSQTVRAELMNLMPAIESRTRAGVFGAIERGGREAQLVGRKN